MPASRSSRRAQVQRLRELRWMTAVLLGDDERLAARADEVRAHLRAAAPIDEVLYLWEMERVTALAVHRAADLGVEHEAWTQRADERRREAEVAATFDDLALSGLVRTFESAEIPMVVLKGTPLARRLHGSTGLRARSSDVDVLVATTDLFRAADLLTGAGWSKPTDPIYADGLPQHHLELIGAGPRPNVEVHWRLQWYDPTASDEQRFLEHRASVDGVPVPSPIDQLLVLLHAWARDGFHAMRLGADIAAWWRTFGAAHSPGALRAIADSQVSRPLTASATVAARLLGTPAPYGGAPDRRTRLAVGAALTDTPQAERITYSQAAFIDQLICPEPLRRERLIVGLFRTPELLRVRYPRVPAAFIPLLRLASAGRTIRNWAPLGTKALRQARREAQQRRSR